MQTAVDAKAAKQVARLPEAQHRRLLAWGRQLELDPHAGQQLQKARFPRRFGPLDNLWRLPLPEGWRALYTVESFGEATTRVVILWVGTHKEYDRVFGYRTS